MYWLFGVWFVVDLILWGVMYGRAQARIGELERRAPRPVVLPIPIAEHKPDRGAFDIATHQSHVGTQEGDR